MVQTELFHVNFRQEFLSVFGFFCKVTVVKAQSLSLLIVRILSITKPIEWRKGAHCHDNTNKWDNTQVNSFELKKKHFSAEDLIYIQMHVNPVSLKEVGKTFVMNQ